MRKSKLELEPKRLKRITRGPLAALAFVSLSLLPASGFVRQTSLNATEPSTEMSQGEKEIALTVTVTDKHGGFVAGLKKESFSVLINRTSQEILEITREDVPVSVGILVDLSGSIGIQSKRIKAVRLGAIREGLAHFVSLANKANEYFLVSFSNVPELLVDNTREGSAIPDRIASLEIKGQTALYDACYVSIEKVAAGAHRKRAIILFSDGVENSSTRGPSAVERLLKETDVLVYSISMRMIGIRKNLIEPVTDFNGIIGDPILKKLARHSGGLAFFPAEPAHMKAIFDLIGLELKNQYRIVIRPQFVGKRDKWQPLKVNVTPPPTNNTDKLIVRTREGFYPSAGLR